MRKQNKKWIIGLIGVLLVVVAIQSILLWQKTNHLNALKRDQDTYKQRHFEILNTNQLL